MQLFVIQFTITMFHVVFLRYRIVYVLCTAQVPVGHDLCCEQFTSWCVVGISVVGLERK
jgi:hypothetical protein